MDTNKSMSALNTSSAINCSQRPIESLEQMFVSRTMGPRIQAGQQPVRRPVFLKPHGCARATFVTHPDLSDQYRIGVFKYDSLNAWVRFASDTLPGASDFKTTTGIGIKLFGVESKKLLDTDEESQTLDFILQNHDVFFVDTAKDMCEFTYAGIVKHDYNSYLQEHPITQQILKAMEKEVSSVLQISYWSVLPYAFGSNRYVKYKIEPVVTSNPEQILGNNPNYLHDDLKQRLLKGEVRLTFSIQLQTDPNTMPLDLATARWDESKSKPIPVATIILHKQDIDRQGQPEYGENLSYNPWRTLAEHAPVGSISEARKVVYQAAANLRRFKNGIPVVEPLSPRELNP